MKTGTKWLLCTVAVVLSIAGIAPRAEAAAKQMPITFGGYTGRSETLTNFPVLVVLSNGVGSGFTFGDFVTTNGYDLRFATNSTSTNWLDYEIESWNTNAGQASYVWVRVPTIPGDGLGSIYAKWGDSGNSNQLACTTNGMTWDVNYRGVWHLASPAITNDSTANRYNGTNSSATATNGPVGGAAYFNGSSKITVGNLGSTPSSYMLECWGRRDGNTGGGYGVFLTPSTNYSAEMAVVNNGNIYFGDLNVTYGTWTGVWTDQTAFHHVAVNISNVALSGTSTLYFDGADKGSISGKSTLGAWSNCRIGGAWGGGCDFKGLMDEVRISSTTRSTNWIWASYQAIASNAVFNGYGTVETVGAGGGVLPAIVNAAASGVTGGGATFNGTLTSTGSPACAVGVYWGADTNSWVTLNWFNGATPDPSWTNYTLFSTNISLSPSQTYYYTYVASNAAGVVTAAPPVALITADVTLQATDANASWAAGDVGVFRVGRGATVTNAALVVNYAIGGTGTNGTDYGPIASNVTVQAGQTNATVTIAPIAAGAPGGTKTVTLTLAPGGYVIGTPSNDTVTIQRQARTIYVATNGTHDVANSFNTWAGAATNIHAAVAIAGAYDSVLVSNGTYAITNTLMVTNAFSLSSVNGRGVTILARNASYGSFGVMVVSNASAWVTGVTVSNGNAGTASGISIYGGTVSNAIVTACDLLKAVYIQNALLTGSVVSNNLRDALYIGANGTVQDCVIAQNRADLGGYYTPVAIDGNGALMDRCRVLNNYAIGGWGRYANAYGVYLNNGTLRNTLVAGNINLDAWTQNNPGPGGVLVAGGTMENCTIVANTNYTTATGGKGVHQTGGAIRNCIVYGNGGSLSAGDYTTTGGAISNSLAPELTSGPPNNNLNGNPSFGDAAYHLAGGSPCVNAGTNQAWMDTAVDLDGTARKLSGVVDMGAYEQDPATIGFSIGLSGDAPLNGLNSLDVVFHASSASTVTWYGWDFNNDGTFERTGANLANVTNTFGVGLYTVVLKASNDVGLVAWATNASPVSVVTNDIYVATNGTHTFPFETWGKAATNVNTAVAAAVGGCMVHVGTGTFVTTAQLDLSAAIRMEGSGRDATILQYGAGNGVMKLGHTNAFATALTVKGGSGGIASGIYITGGTASNVMVTGCGSPLPVSIANGTMVASVISNNNYGVTVDANGTLEACDVVNNPHYAGGGYAPVCLSGAGALVNRCRVVDNYSPGGAGRYLEAFGVRLGAGTLRNTLVARNINQDAWTQNNPGPGGVLVAGGTMENCTITANTNYTTATGGKGVHQTGGTIRNCIIYGNGGTTVTGEYVNAGGTIEYSMAPELAHGSQGNVTNDPQFTSLAAGDYTLRNTSPCIDAGTAIAGMTVDLAGAPRTRDGNGDSMITIDMGAYEAPTGWRGSVLRFR